MPEVISILDEEQNHDWQTNFPLHFLEQQNTCYEELGWVQTHSKHHIAIKVHEFLHMVSDAKLQVEGKNG